MKNQKEFAFSLIDIGTKIEEAINEHKLDTLCVKLPEWVKEVSKSHVIDKTEGELFEAIRQNTSLALLVLDRKCNNSKGIIQTCEDCIETNVYSLYSFQNTRNGLCVCREK